jgi:hypothetical protein
MDMLTYDEAKWITDFSCPFFSCYRREDGKKYDKEKGPAVIFLDIDGVIQPIGSQKRFDYNFSPSIEYLCKKFHNDIYKTMSPYDVMAAYYDWDSDSLTLIRDLSTRENAGIVLHSSWANFITLEGLKGLFAFYGMDDFIIDALPYKESKAERIKWYLNRYPAIKRYVVIDDDDYLEKMFPWHFVKTSYRIKEQNLMRAFLLLDHTFSFAFSNDHFSLFADGKNAISSKLCIGEGNLLVLKDLWVEERWMSWAEPFLSLYFSGIGKAARIINQTMKETELYSFVLPLESVDQIDLLDLREILEYYEPSGNKVKPFYRPENSRLYLATNTYSPLSETAACALQEKSPLLFV